MDEFEQYKVPSVVDEFEQYKIPTVDNKTTPDNSYTGRVSAADKKTEEAAAKETSREAAKARGEAGLSLATSAVSPISGVAGVIEGILPESMQSPILKGKSAGERYDISKRESTYEPRTEGGKARTTEAGELLSPLGVPFDYLGKGVTKLAEVAGVSEDKSKLAGELAKDFAPLKVPKVATALTKGAIKAGDVAVSSTAKALGVSKKQLEQRAPKIYEQEVTHIANKGLDVGEITPKEHETLIEHSKKIGAMTPEEARIELAKPENAEMLKYIRPTIAESAMRGVGDVAEHITHKIGGAAVGLSIGSALYFLHPQSLIGAIGVGAGLGVGKGLVKTRRALKTLEGGVPPEVPKTPEYKGLKGSESKTTPEYKGLKESTPPNTMGFGEMPEKDYGAAGDRMWSKLKKDVGKATEALRDPDTPGTPDSIAAKHGFDDFNDYKKAKDALGEQHPLNQGGPNKDTMAMSSGRPVDVTAKIMKGKDSELYTHPEKISGKEFRIYQKDEKIIIQSRSGPGSHWKNTKDRSYTSYNDARESLDLEIKMSKMDLEEFFDFVAKSIANK